MKRSLILALLAAMLAVRLSTAAPLWTAGTAGATTINGVACSQNLYVTVGSGGTLFTSTNGHTWTAASYAGTAHALLAVTYGNGAFVAVGESGWTVSSADGVHWTSAGTGVTSQDLYGIVYAAGKFVAVGDSGTIIYSSTGTSWTAAQYAASVPNKTDDLAAVTYGNSRFIAVGVQPDTTYVSSNGTLWTQTGGPNDWDHLTAATCGNGLFAITGQEGIYTSPDGTNWTTQAVFAHELYAIAYGNGLFVAVGWEGAMFLSVGGTNCWTTIESDSTNQIYGIVYNAPLFVTAGEAGHTLSSALSGAASLPPKMNWTPARYAPGTPDTSTELMSVAYGGSSFTFRGFVAVGKNPNTAFVSSNGIQWTEGGAGLDNGDPLVGVNFNNGRYAAVGNYGRVYSSAYATNWATASLTGASLNTISAFAGDYFAVGDGGTLLLCTNWPNWTILNSGVTENLYAVASGMQGLGESVVVGATGRIITSGNLFRNWATRVSGTTASLYGIAYGNGCYVAVGEQGTIIASTNGTTWTQASTNYNYPAVDLLGVAYGNGLFVAVGGDGWTATSRDGFNWSWGTSATFDSLTAIAYNNGTFVAVSASGTLMLSAVPVLGPAKVLPNRSVQVPVTGGPSQTVQILVSTNLSSWSVLTTITLDSNGAGQFTDSSAPSYSRRFYCAVAL